MRFDLLDYETTVGHFSLYYDAGGMFDLEINAGKYLAGDLGVTTTISRKFGSGWEVGGYATFTDVPFNIFGEGSFDKAAKTFDSLHRTNKTASTRHHPRGVQTYRGKKIETEQSQLLREFEDFGDEIFIYNNRCITFLMHKFK